MPYTLETVEQMIAELTIRVGSYYDERVKSEYPLVRVANIVCGAEDGVAAMRTFIDEMNASRDALLAAIASLESMDIVTTFTRGSDDEMAACVHACMADLTDLQASAMIDAVYPFATT
jgi:hypothetical protein